MPTLVRSDTQLKITPIPIHREIEMRMDKYERIEILLEQNEDKIVSKFCRQLPNENNSTYTKRQKTFIDTFINISQDLVTAPVNSVFSQGCKLDYKSGDSSTVKAFNDNVTRSNEKTPIKKYMKDFVGVALRSYGTICTVLDKPRVVARNAVEEREIAMPYLSNIRLQDIINWELDEFGNFEWFVYKKPFGEPWINPFNDIPPVVKELECMYTKTDYIVREIGSSNIHPLSYTHNWGFVPVVLQGSFLLRQSDILGNAAMFQSSSSIINANNNLNVGNWELYKHGGALLLFHEDSISQRNMETNKVGEVNVKKYDNDGALDWSGENPPEYLLKELQTQEFMAWAMFYMQKAIENERDLKSVAKKGTDGEMVQESGFAKMVDREPLEANLISLSEDMTIWYTKTTDMVAQMVNDKNDSTLEFDTDYDLRTVKQLYEELKLAIDSKMLEMSPMLIKEQGKNIAAHVVRDQNTLNKINTEIDDWNPDLMQEEMDKLVGDNFGKDNNFNNNEEK